MKSLIAIAVLLAATPAFSQSYLCIADHSAITVVNQETGDASTVTDLEETPRFVVSQNESGDFQAGFFGLTDSNGNDFFVWNDCESFIGQGKPRKLYCRHNYGYVHAEYSFAVNSNNSFVAKDVNPGVEGFDLHRTFVGKCSRI